MRTTSVQELAVALFLLTVFGCSQDETGQSEMDSMAFTRAKETVVSSWEDAASRTDRCFEPMARHCEELVKAMENHGDQVITTVPLPYRWGVAALNRGEGPLTLIVNWLERGTDVTGLRVREYWPGGRVISEVYQFPPQVRANIRKFAEGTWVHGTIIELTERSSPEVTLRGRADSGQGEGDETRPQLLLAKPSQEVHVLISLIDEVGHESRALPLTWLERAVGGSER